jgi:hypothetical protein
MSGESPTFVPKNSGGATPTIVKIVDPIFSFLFKTEESCAMLLFHHE